MTPDSTTPTLNPSMTSDRIAQTQSGKLVSAGATVEYVALVPGGMVRVRFPDGSEEVMHPHCFKELRDGE